MARDVSLLTSPTPAAVVPAEVTINHVQLRDVIICPKEAGVVNYIQRESIVEHDLKRPSAAPRIIANLGFPPNSLASLRLGPSGEDVLLAAGGHEADIHISYHASGSRSSKNVWSIDGRLPGSINNSVLLTTCLSVARSNQSAVEPRLGVSNNDCTVRLYDIPLRGQALRRIRKNEEQLQEAGVLKLDVPVNHSSISPDGRTLLSVGDSNKVYIHDIAVGSRVTLSPIATYCLPTPDYSTIPHPSDSLVASFSTAFSSDGSKFAVASQEGVVAVWDVRSSKPLKVCHTDKMRPRGAGNGFASGWLSDTSPWDWGRDISRGPGWSVRNVKFGGSSNGKEVLTFTEHKTLIHVIDAQTFETEQVLRMPTARLQRLPASSSQPIQRPVTSPTRVRYLHSPATAPPAGFRRTSRHHSFYSIPSPSPSPRTSFANTVHNFGTGSTPSIVHAVGDAFRVTYSPPQSIGDSTWRTLSGVSGNRHSPAPRTTNPVGDDRTSHWRSDFDDIVVVPPLGDTDEEGEEEGEIHALFRMHGMEDHAGLALEHEEADSYRAVRGAGGSSSSSQPIIRRRADAHASSSRHPPAPAPMEVDEFELESDCASSRAPSRSGSPRPFFSPSQSRQRHVNHASQVDGDDASTGYSGQPGVDDASQGQREEDLVYDEYLDLAGVCFNPSGESFYVASTRSIAEWKIRGAEKRWWPSDGWR